LAIDCVSCIVHDSDLRVSRLTERCDVAVDRLRRDISVVLRDDALEAFGAIFVGLPEDVLLSRVRQIIFPVRPVVNVEVTVRILDDIEKVLPADAQVDAACSVRAVQILNVLWLRRAEL